MERLSPVVISLNDYEDTVQAREEVIHRMSI